uniref:Uncharacterized protein n=1 Tax=Oryza sativa subsp. japonica TaxID=39947 RepID=Q33AX8_ORYSJ|nr:hypothetical protein LOC_Os10g07069 [Oryza sativa Japonica Group]
MAHAAAMLTAVVAWRGGASSSGGVRPEHGGERRDGGRRRGKERDSTLG